MSVCAAIAVKCAFVIPIIPILMLPSIASLKIAAMVAALGLDTAEWSKPSTDMTNQVQALADAMSSASKGEQPKVTLQETINKIKDLADKSNDKDAQFAMGLFLQQSNQQGALDQAVAYYKKAADNGQLQAMNNYGFIIAASTQDVAKVKEGVASIKAASDKGLNAARRNMAAIYLRGMAGEKQDPAAAQKLLETAAAEKDHQAAFELAQFYLGAGGEATKNDDTAWTWLNKAADGGNPNALAALGSVLFDGKKFGNKEIKADPAAAVKKFEELAAQNVPAGLRTMGELHEGGLAGVPKDFKKALEYYGKAAQGNDAVAQVRLAGFYDRGVDLDPKDSTIDVAPNAAAALELYRLAAQNNVALAIYNVGTFYEAGRAVDRDAQKAFAYFLQSAVNGFVPGMQKAGVYYLNGAGTLKDPVAATAWFSRTAAAGLAEGHLSLGVMTENGLVPQPQGSNASPFLSAADSYVQASESVNASDAVRMEALLRLGSLYFRGAMSPSGDTPKPNYERAYVYFKQASDIDPNNALAKAARDEAAKNLSQDQIKKADSDIERIRADRKARAEKAAAPAAATPAPDAAPAAPAAPATAPKGKAQPR